MQTKRQPKVSICIPTYENPEGITRLLESILTQIYTDYEVIITDDSKTDRVQDAVQDILDTFVSYGMGENRSRKIRYIRNETPQGAVANWNKAISYAGGEFIKLMHHDDWFTDEMCLKMMVELLEQNPEVDLIFTGTYQVPKGGVDKTARGISPEDAALIRSDFRNLFLGNTIGAPSAVLVRSSALKIHDIVYDTNLTWLVDEEYYMQVLSHNPKFAYTDRPLISIGLSEDQLTEKVGDDQKLLRYEYKYVYDKYGLKSEACYREKLRQIRLTKLIRVCDTAEYLYGKYLDKLNAGPAGKVLNGLYWLALFTEIGIVIIDKSSILNPYEGLLFRLTFVLFGVKMLGTKFRRDERLWIFLWLVLGVLNYRASGRNELLRITVFMAASLGMDIQKALKAEWITTLAGSILLAVLSILGILGTVTITGNIDGEIDTRLCLGMGHPNSFHCMVAMLCLLGLYLYYDRVRIWQYAALFVANILLFVMTKSMAAFGLAAVAIVSYGCLAGSKKRAKKTGIATGTPKKHRWLQNGVYYTGDFVLTIGIVVSVVASIWNPEKYPLLWKLDHLLTGRMGALWDTSFHEGTLSTWTWFGSVLNAHFFDMGWVRIIYWYGVIPAIAVIWMTAELFGEVRRRKDMAALIVLALCCGYTVFEAHLVSEYLARNFCLLIAAWYLQQPKEETHAG